MESSLTIVSSRDWQRQQPSQPGIDPVRYVARDQLEFASLQSTILGAADLWRVLVA